MAQDLIKNLIKCTICNKCIKRESNPRRVEFNTRMATTQVTTTPLMPAKETSQKTKMLWPYLHY